jgi:hypothetical protein
VCAGAAQLRLTIPFNARPAAYSPSKNRAGIYLWEGLDVHSEITRNENYNHHDTNEVENIQFYSPLCSTLETCAALRIKRTTQRLEPEPLSKLDPYPFVLFPRS